MLLNHCFQSLGKLFSHLLKPSFIIGDPSDPYLLRWHVIPRNNLCNIYLHKILKDDDDRALHDHPYDNISIVLSKYGYLERTADSYPHPIIRFGGSIIKRRAEEPHRLSLVVSPCWSLFITGPRYREWGFHTDKGWVPWYEFCDPENRGQIKK